MLQLAGAVDDQRRRDFRRLLAFSGLGHVLLFASLAFAPTFDRDVGLPGVVSVDLVAAPSLDPPSPAPPAPSPPKPEPKPEAKPEPKPEPKPLPAPDRPKPKPPVPAKKVLPQEVVDPKKPRPAQASQEELDDVLARLRDETEPLPDAEPAPPAPPRGGGPGVRVSPEVAAWLKAARNHVRQVWAVPPGFRTERLVTRVLVELDSAGNVLRPPRIVERSGNPWYDDGVVRGIQKASPLPPPPKAGEWSFVFNSEES